MSAVPTVAVVGAGPAGIAAARWLRGAGAHVVLVVPEACGEYLPGTLAVATGDAPAASYRARVDLAGVEILPVAAEAIEPGVLRAGGLSRRVEAIVAAPGLVLDPLSAPTRGPTVGFWDPAGAEAAAPKIAAVEGGVLDVVISSLPYRCPPAPYGLAMRLARRARRLGRALQVRLFTPESHPLAALGSTLGDALLASCGDAGVEVHLGVVPGAGPTASGNLADDVYGQVEADLTIVVPRHRPSPLVAGLVGSDGPLVPVDGQFATEMPGVFVVGDAAASPYPRAAGPAEWSGTVAAAAVISELGLDGARPAPQPSADCFVDHGNDTYGRIGIAYPDGPPPKGRPAVSFAPATPERARDFEAAHRLWQRLRSDAGAP